MLSIIKKTLIILFSAFFLLIATLFLYIYFNEAKIVAYIIEEINKKIDTKITASTIDVSLFKSFPNVSLSFSKLKIESSKNYQKDKLKTPELLSANKLHIHFNLYHFLKKNFKVNGISAEGGYINILTAKNGNTNYVFWKNSDESVSNEIKLELSRVVLEQMYINYVDQQKKFYLSGYCNFAKLYGVIGSKNIDGNIDLAITNLDINKYFAIKEKLEIRSAISFKNKELKFEKVSLAFNKHLVEGSFYYKNPDYNAQFKTSHLNYLDFKDYLADYIPKEIKIIDGNVSIEGSFGGSMKNQFSHSELEVSLSKIKAKYINYDIFNCDAFFHITKKDKYILLDLLKSNIQYSNSSIYLVGKYNINEVHNFKVVAEGQVYLCDLNSFITDSSNYNFQKGKSTIKIEVQNKIPYKGNKGLKVSDLLINAKGELKDFSGAFFNNYYKLSDAEAKFVYANDMIVLHEASGQINSSNFSSDLQLSNLFAYMDNKTDLVIKGNIECDSIVPVHFLSADTSKSDSEKSKRSSISGAFKLTCNHLVYDKIKLQKLSCRVDFAKDKYMFSEINANFCKGVIIDSELGLIIDNSLNIQSKLRFKEIDIRELFRTFENFGQTQLLAENINGKLSGNCQNSMIWMQKQLMVPSIIGAANFEIVNGSLNNFKPIAKLAKYLEISDINNIKFKNIKNTISISDSKIFIPEMEIQSSAINLNISGQHSFLNEYEYHFNMLISDILIPKKKNKKQDYEFGVVEEEHKNRSRLYIKMAGKDDKYKFSYDNRKAMTVFSEKMHDEKKKIKEIVIDEFTGQGEESVDVIKKLPAIEKNEFSNVSAPEKSIRSKSTAVIEWKDE